MLQPLAPSSSTAAADAFHCFAVKLANIVCCSLGLLCCSRIHLHHPQPESQLEIRTHLSFSSRLLLYCEHRQHAFSSSFFLLPREPPILLLRFACSLEFEPASISVSFTIKSFLHSSFESCILP